MFSSDPIHFCGATLLADNSCRFTVWAPLKKTMLLHLPDPERKVGMSKDEAGYFTATVENIKPGTKYSFIPDNEKAFPDPASNFQPQGVHGPSQVIDHACFHWTDQSWKGLPFRELVLYEMHIGTFTKEGTFEAIIPRLKALADLGINAIELMPVSQFPGNRNWGYDGVCLYAVQNSYGGPEGLKKLVNACHEEGIAVMLDVVYNHLGPEGNYLIHFAPYFTNTYRTPWGDAINYDGRWSDGVRDYFCNNALYWFQYYHLDGLRLDAVHMVFDNGALHFCQYLNDKVQLLQQQLGRPLHIIAESDLNSPRVVNSPAIGGYGFSAQWLDDFHHALYAILDQKGKERYYDFGLMEQLAKTYTDGFVHSGEYVQFRKRKHGVSSAGIPGNKFVAFTSNHDQVGNRPNGERLPVLIDFERLKLAAAALLLSPYVPMLFMGEEYADAVPFYYFISHSDPALIEAVRKGRKEEFKDFKTEGESPDPQDERAFDLSKLQWHQRDEGHGAILLRWYKKLISLRNAIPALKNFNKNDIHAQVIAQFGLIIHRQEEGVKRHLLCLFNFSEKEIQCSIPFYAQKYSVVIDSRGKEWNENYAEVPVMPPSLSAGKKVMMMPLSVSVYKSF
jgi:maltooligosyltrehalose trehalohydrolase